MYLQTQILDKDVSSAELKLLTLAARIQDAEHTLRHQLTEQAVVNSSKADTSGESTREAGGGNGQKSNAAGAVSARGAGVRALLAAHGDLAAQLRANSSTLARLADLAHSLQP